MFMIVGRVPLVLGQACLRIPPVGGQVQIEFQQCFHLTSALLLVIMPNTCKSLLILLADSRVIIQALPYFQLKFLYFFLQLFNAILPPHPLVDCGVD